VAEQTDTQALRRMWSQSAAKIAQDIRDGKPPAASEVAKLQDTLEAIEGRENLERLNALTRGESPE
jgi:hypothetical protein